jgi:hypothetical protein
VQLQHKLYMIRLNEEEKTNLCVLSYSEISLAFCDLSYMEISSAFCYLTKTSTQNIHTVKDNKIVK